MRNVREQIEDAENERAGDREQADLNREHHEARRLLGALPSAPSAERGQEAEAEREDLEAGS